MRNIASKEKKFTYCFVKLRVRLEYPKVLGLFQSFLSEGFAKNAESFFAIFQFVLTEVWCGSLKVRIQIAHVKIFQGI